MNLKKRKKIQTFFRCCRAHDLCPFKIKKFSSAFGVVNTRCQFHKLFILNSGQKNLVRTSKICCRGLGWHLQKLLQTSYIIIFRSDMKFVLITREQGWLNSNIKPCRKDLQGTVTRTYLSVGCVAKQKVLWHCLQTPHCPTLFLRRVVPDMPPAGRQPEEQAHRDVLLQSVESSLLHFAGNNIFFNYAIKCVKKLL
jgi:Phospholipase A2